ncbi:MAG TPA: SPOR domain-containing protein [Terriglobales bacterium]|nr:SPOR domain-containing protein [Terriglobales bacterium]
MLQDRRQHPRLTPSTPQLVLLDESKYSLLFDLGEGGLSIEGFAAQRPRDEFNVEFDLPEGNGCIQAKAEVVWTSDSGYRTGFRFLDLTDPNREQLKNWIAGSISNRLSVIEGRISQPTFPPLEGAEAPVALAEKSKSDSYQGPSLFSVHPSSQGEAGDIKDEERSPIYAAGLVLALVMALVAFVTGYYWRAAHSQRRAVTPAAAPAPQSALPVPNPSAPQSSPQAALSAPPSSAAITAPAPAASAPPATPALSEPGFALQVAAMSTEANADALSAKLHEQSFNSFVVKRQGDHLFRVLVGPFKTPEEAQKVQSAMRAQDYKPLLRPWSPE